MFEYKIGSVMLCSCLEHSEMLVSDPSKQLMISEMISLDNTLRDIVILWVM